MTKVYIRSSKIDLKRPRARSNFQPASSGQEHNYIISVVRTKLETTKVWLSLRVFKFERLMISVNVCPFII